MGPEALDIRFDLSGLEGNFQSSPSSTLSSFCISLTAGLLASAKTPWLMGSLGQSILLLALWQLESVRKKLF